MFGFVHLDSHMRWQSQADKAVGSKVSWQLYAKLGMVMTQAVVDLRKLLIYGRQHGYTYDRHVWYGNAQQCDVAMRPANPVYYGGIDLCPLEALGTRDDGRSRNEHLPKMPDSAVLHRRLC